MEILEQFRANTGETLGELSRKSPVVVLFVRHLGCTFCREALADLAKHRPGIVAQGMSLAIVHMSTDDQARALAAQYKLDDVPRVSDPEQRLYAAFGLTRGKVLNVVGPQVWLRGLAAVIKHGIGIPQGDVLQMPGAFVLHNNEIVRAFRHTTSADLPDFEGLTCTLK